MRCRAFWFIGYPLACTVGFTDETVWTCRSETSNDNSCDIDTQLRPNQAVHSLPVRNCTNWCSICFSSRQQRNNISRHDHSHQRRHWRVSSSGRGSSSVHSHFNFRRALGGRSPSSGSRWYSLSDSCLKRDEQRQTKHNILVVSTTSQNKRAD